VWIRGSGAVLTLALVAATPLAAWAFVFQNGETITAAEGLSDDLYAAGQTVTVTGRIDGDVVAAGRMVTIAGAVTGGILALAQDVRIAGPVGRTVRAAGQSVAIESAVRIDALAVGQEIYIRQQAHIGRDLLASGETVYVAANVDRFARLIGNTVVVAGRVGKGLRVDARHLTIMPTAQIDGDVRYSAELPADVRAGAVIKGKIERVARPTRPQTRLLGLAVPVVFRIWEALALLLIGLFIVTVIPHRAREISTMALRRFPHSLLVGIVVLLAFPVVCTVLTATVIGIPLAVAIAFVFAAGVYPSQAFVAAALGRVLLVPIGRGKDLSTSLHLTVAVGTLILALLFALPFGWVVRLLAMMSGWGAVCVTVWRATGGWTGITAGLRPSQ
jgi:hypothetical protein